MRSDLPTGTVTFLYTDIEGSTRLLHELGPDAYSRVLDEHRFLLRDAFAAHGGVEVDTQGDAFFAAFPTAEGAAAAALAATSGLASGPIRVRIGLHTGTPTLGAEGYVGVDVHRGARVAALAHGGQIVVSPTTAALLDAPLGDLGIHQLKDFEGVTRLFQLGGGGFPPLRTPGSVELPVPATRFVGRERELFDAVSLVYERDPRVLTIVGPGGTGKTRFAVELTRLLADEADGGSVFVALAPLRDAALLLPTIAERLGAGSTELRTIAARIGDRRTHVLCDNVEHLLPEAAPSLAELVAAAPGLRLVATSREPLRIQGEVELDLPSLAEEDAVALFLERAHAVRPDLAASEETVSELCARLDRLPLALELAAARTKLLAPETLLARLGESLDLLKGTRDADERHATLRATISWSYDLLDEDERQLFRRLSVFRGGCTLESAETVCDADLELLASLLDKSLLRRRTGRLGEERVWMLEIIREFAAHELVESGEADVRRRRHAELMLEIATSAHLTEDDDERFRLPLVLSEEQDMRAAVDWASEQDVELALALVVALENFWNVHAHKEVLRRLDELLPRGRSAPPELRAASLRVLGGALHVDGQLEACDAAYEESLVLYRELGNERGVASILQRLGNSAYNRGELERSRGLLQESQQLAEGRFPYIEIANVTVLGRIDVQAGEVETGAGLLRRAAGMAAEVDWHWWQSSVLASLALIEIDHGDPDEAERLSEDALRLIRDDESRSGTIAPLTVIARAALARGDHVRAGLLQGALEKDEERFPSRYAERVRTERAGPLLEELSPEFVAAVGRGRKLDLWEAVALALGQLDELDEPQTVP
jgi:predicted ATPase/class 3 adenylate cyclase